MCALPTAAPSLPVRNTSAQDIVFQKAGPVFGKYQNKRISLGDFKLDLPIPGTENRKTRILFFATGGTISAKGTSDFTYDPGAVGARQMIGAARKPRNTRIEPHDVFRIDSKSIEPKHWLVLQRQVISALDAIEKGDAIVIAHGTDTMEMTAAFLHFTVPGEKLEGKKIVFVGSMKPSDSATPDGEKNLRDALRLAKSKTFSGIVAMMNGKIFSPPYFRKGHTVDVDAFKRINGLEIGKLKNGKVIIRNQPVAASWTANIDMLADHPQDAMLPNVPVIHVQSNATVAEMKNRIANEIRPSAATRSAGNDFSHSDDEQRMPSRPAGAIVVAGTGNGTMHDDIEQYLAKVGIPVVRASKVGDGEVVRNGAAKDDALGPRQDDREARNFVCAGKLMPETAALLVQLAMVDAESRGIPLTADRLRERFAEYQSPEFRPPASAA
ncbi:MAG TPA: asparaginase domain-containing protein [Noviherbaspirillum sp.]|jgi:L-asparaginase|nr:asparaginase domain-containing protein [Noviherbaspirillum sp.]